MPEAESGLRIVPNPVTDFFKVIKDIKNFNDPLRVIFVERKTFHNIFLWSIKDIDRYANVPRLSACRRRERKSNCVDEF
jgi:hypothetical protein